MIWVRCMDDSSGCVRRERVSSIQLKSRVQNFLYPAFDNKGEIETSVPLKDIAFIHDE